MWRTPLGVRTLRPFEWRLFRIGLTSLYDDIEFAGALRPPSETGVQVFDQLHYASKLAMLALVGKAVRNAASLAPMRQCSRKGQLRPCIRGFEKKSSPRFAYLRIAFPPIFSG